MFVAAPVKDQCFLPASVASAGLSLHTSMQTAPVQQQKAASAIYLSKAFFEVTPVAEVQAGGTRHSESTSRRSQTKKHRDPGQVIRRAVDADVYIKYVQDCSGCEAPVT